MTVFHLISGGETGGSKNHLLSLLKQFPDGEVILGVMQEGQLSSEARAMGIETIVFNQSSRYDFSVISKMKTFLKNSGIKIIHTHGPRANFFTYLLRKTMTFKWVTTIHSDPSKDFIKGGLKGKVFTALNMRIIHNIDHFFAVSHRFKDMLIGFGVKSEKITVIYNGISFEKPETKQLNRAEYHLSEADFVVTMVARLHPIKNHPVAFKAIQQLIADGISVKLLCVGDGPARKNIEDLLTKMNLRENVELLGFRKDVHAILEISDVCLLTSDSESFPLVLLESARAHKPIVSTDVGGVDQLISNDKHGRVVPIKDADAIYHALKELYILKTENKLTTIGDMLFEFAKANFSLDQLHKVTSDTYNKI